MRTLGRIAGVLFAAGGVAAVPAYALMSEPAAPRWIFFLPVLAAVSGIGCFLVPWDRLPAWAFHVVPVAATLEVAVSVWAVGPHAQVTSWYYVFVAVYAALAFRSRAAIVAHVSFCAVALAAPIFYEAGKVHDALVMTIVGAPTLVVAAAAVAVLREQSQSGQDALRDLAERDALTGVGNYRTLYDRLTYEIVRHERHNRRFVLTLLDLDRFKQVNEEHGHLEGDRVLREVGRVLAFSVREQDTLARQGGDEFSVLAPEADASDAEQLAERLSAALASIQINGRPLTASIGWAVFPEDGTSPDALVARADNALLESKRDRRSRQYAV
jgi:diguanylate cyclase (GGDEF)-like protein